MKKIVRTIAIVAIAATGFLAIGAGQAMASPASDYVLQNPDAMKALHEAYQNGNLDALNDSGNAIVPPDEVLPPDDTVPPDEAVPNGGTNEPATVAPGEPGASNQHDQPRTATDTGTQQTQQPPAQVVTGSKLPNTGTSLLMVAVAGALLVVAGFGARQIALRQTH